MSVPPPPPPLPTTPARIFFTERRPPGIRFTEHMSGCWSPPEEEMSPDDRTAYERAFADGKREGRRLDLVVTIVAENLATMIASANHEGRFVGTATITGGPVTITGGPVSDVLVNEGRFHLFVEDPNLIASRKMEYVAEFRTPDGDSAHFVGFKAIRLGGGIAGFHVESPAPGSRLWLSQPRIWKDQTRLFFRLEGGGQIPRAIGILTVSARDFLRQLLTIRPVRAASRTEACDTVMRFMLFYAGVLRDIYGGAFARSRYAPPDWRSRTPRPLRIPGRERIHLQRTSEDVPTDDGSRIRLTRYRTPERDPGDPILLAPGMGVRAHSFAIDTVHVNFVEYLVGQGYDVWLLDYRSSPELETSRGAYSLDQIATFDWPKAVHTVIERTGGGRGENAGKVDVVAHCVGAATFMMAALDRRFEDGIHAAVCSQVATHPMVSGLIELKAIARLGTWLELFFGLRSLPMTVDATNTSRKTLTHRLLKFYPTEDPCDNPICRYVRFVFGESYLHANLNRLTHDMIIDMFGDPRPRRQARASLRALRHLSRITTKERLVGEDGEDRYVHDDKARNITFPLGVMWGERNAIFRPKGLEESVRWLRRAGRDVTEIPLPNYGHMDTFIGARAHERENRDEPERDFSVFPRIVAFLRTPRPRASASGAPAAPPSA